MFSSRFKLSLIPLILLLWISHFFVDVMLGIWPLFKTLKQLDLSQAGLIVAGGAFIGEGSQIFFGSLSDRGYRQLLIILGIFLSCANLFLPYFSDAAVYFLLF